MHIGLGAAKVIDSLEVRWPSGEKQTFTTIPQAGIIVPKDGLRHVTIREQGGTNRVLRRLNPPR